MKLIKCLIWAVVIAFLVYNSIYFKKLSTVKAAAAKKFDPAAFARNYFDKKLLPATAKAPTLDALLEQLQRDQKEAFKANAHALSIGNVKFFVVQGTGTVTRIDENDVYVHTAGHEVKIATEYIFGNALRDAPGIIGVNDFTNSMDLNNVSAEVDKLVRTEVLPPFKSKVKTGDLISFAGAFELNQEHLNLGNIEVIPVKLQIN